MNGLKMTIDLINSAFSFYPQLKTDLDLNMKLAKCYLYLDDPQAAHLIVDPLLDSHKERPVLYLMLGKVLSHSQTSRSAVEAFTRCLYLLPQDLKEYNDDDLNIARETHLQLIQISIEEGNLEPAKHELERFLSLPLTDNKKLNERAVSIMNQLFTQFHNLNDLTTCMWISQTAAKVYPDDYSILILYAYMLLSRNGPYFDPLKAFSIVSKISRLDKEYIKASNILDYIQSEKGDFLPWFMLAETYFYLGEYNISFDLLEVSMRKVRSPFKCNEFSDLAVQLLRSSNDKALIKNIELLLSKFNDQSPQYSSLSRFEIVTLPYDKRVSMFNLLESPEKSSPQIQKEKHQSLQQHKQLKLSLPLPPPQQQQQQQQQQYTPVRMPSNEPTPATRHSLLNTGSHSQRQSPIQVFASPHPQHQHPSQMMVPMQFIQVPQNLPKRKEYYEGWPLEILQFWAMDKIEAFINVNFNFSNSVLCHSHLLLCQRFWERTLVVGNWSIFTKATSLTFLLLTMASKRLLTNLYAAVAIDNVAEPFPSFALTTSSPPNWTLLTKLL
ncbi:hypothetical protein BOH78_2971 [Pichia kudriavzevii]|uniref:Uncharacterized protein n=1 Tax=Pichia kudriavzevii TaxID=4909 RepID=A0A1V2LL49_PICKU|nr:hypothetical protein BOH78_2971 [Pichia kudriavzevii]